MKIFKKTIAILNDRRFSRGRTDATVPTGGNMTVSPPPAPKPKPKF